MSHEIRTPLNGILGTAELMELEADSSNIKELVDIQKESGYRLLNTLNSILAMTKLEAENEDAQLNIVSISGLVDETFKLYQAKAKLKGIDLSIERLDAIYVKANLGMLSQCINNLVDNALKFTKKGKVSMKVYKDQNNAIIQVIDTGIGISEDAQLRIFEPFWQVQMGQTRQYQGTGLGLSIVKRYVEFIGGTIQLSSKVNDGSIFQINLPAVNTD
jgi:signal transduction histidine kinase